MMGFKVVRRQRFKICKACLAACSSVVSGGEETWS